MKKAIILLIAAIVFSTGCSTVPDVSDPSISVHYLKNGIPVILKKNDSNRIYSVQTVIRGQSALAEKEKAGLEALTLTMLSRGSENYDYSSVRQVMYEKSSAITAVYDNFDRTTFTLNTLDKYFDELFDLYTELLLKPSWDSKEFESVKNDFLIDRQNRENDPYAKASILLNDKFFEGHPYVADYKGDLDSLPNITIDDLKNYYEKAIGSERMYVVAVGNFDEMDLIEKLNNTLGTIADKGNVIEPPPEQNASNELIVEEFEQSEGLAYVRGNFPLPPAGSEDLPAVELAMQMLDDVLFEIVRTRHGACYSVWAHPFSFFANYGNITVYKTSVPGDVKKYVDDAIAVMVNGKSIAAQVNTSGENEYVAEVGEGDTFVPIADTLQFYKDQFVTSFYMEQQTNVSIADEIASSYLYRSDPAFYQEKIDRIQSVTADDIVRVVNDYLVDSEIKWIVLGSADVLQGVNADDFLGFIGEMPE